MHDVIIASDASNVSDFVPETFGRWTTTGPMYRRKSRKVMPCICLCGTIRSVSDGDLRRGRSKSCGCQTGDTLRRHGSPKTSEYYSYRNMKCRCFNPNNDDYADYGGRGIRICDRWLEPDGRGFLNFLADMGPKPDPKLTLDRFPDKNGNYEPGNCRWASVEQQATNKRNNIWLTHQDKTQTISQWTKELGLPRGRISDRLKRGDSTERALRPVTS